LHSFKTVGHMNPVPLQRCIPKAEIGVKNT
jgi:hypothetical protein